MLKRFLKLFFNKNQLAFTLAEVLITLLIIGVVAGIIIPNLLNDTQDAEFKSAFKKTYSDLNQATKLIMLDNGGTLNGVFSSSNSMANLYSQYLTYTKYCPSNVYGNCWNYQADVKRLNGYVGTDWTTSGPAGMISTNGVFLFFLLSNTACGYDTWATLNTCGRIFVDVNGFKKPNMVGKDILMIHVMENNIYPFGIAGDAHAGDCNSSAYGWTCAINYLKQ